MKKTAPLTAFNKLVRRFSVDKRDTGTQIAILKDIAVNTFVGFKLAMNVTH